MKTRCWSQRLLAAVAVLLAITPLSGCRSVDAPVIVDTAPPADTGPRVETPAFWRENGQRELQRLQRTANDATQARNVILFIGDGMGVTTVTAARILQGQQRGRPGEENLLAFERFPATALSKTYTVDMQTAESAGTMTAIMTGVKTRGGAIAVDQVPPRGSCRAMEGHAVPTLLEQAETAGMATGIVSTARITHATPAATYAHVTDRDWEVDARVPPAQRAEGCRDIARQLVEFAHGDGIEVVLGGGRMAFMHAGQADPEEAFRKGMRSDGEDLTATWQTRYPTGQYVWNREQFHAIDWQTVGPVLGLFEADHLEFDADRERDAAGEPALAEMTRAAITRLQRDPDGFFLMIEAGRIDHGHHAGNAYRALTDAIALSDAVEVAAQLTSESDTLIVVTADHSHTLTMAGYPARGSPILGIALDDNGKPQVDALGMAYGTLGYANGPGQQAASDEQPAGPKQFPHFGRGYRPAGSGRAALTQDIVSAPNYLQESMVPMAAETHGGEDVPVYARGPGAQWVRGVLEQNTLYWLMRGVLPQLGNPPPLAR